MKNPLKFFLIYLLSFIMTVVISAGLLFAAALIPRDAVQKNMQESAEYYVEKAADSNIIPGIKATFVDRFADSLILNITYHLDPEHPLESVMWSYFYGYPSQHAPQYLLDSINGAYGENPRMEEYLRYWHGSVVFMKIFHLFWNIKHITVFHCALLLTLTLILLYMLWRRKYYAEIIGLLISLIAVSAWVAPLGLEFYWVFPIMMITAIISLIMIEKNCSERSFILLFLVVGMITVYLDFLTTETITILVPLLLITRIRARKEEHASFIAQFLFSLKCSISWLIGYLGMWAAKWLLAKMILHIEVMPFVTRHIRERMGGNSSLLEEVKSAIQRNIYRLFPIDYGWIGAVILIVALIIFFFIPVLKGQLRIRETIKWKQILLYFLTGLIPLLRFTVMHSHSKGHFVFTFRAQISSVLALFFICSEIFEYVSHRKDHPILPENNPPQQTLQN